MITKQNTIICDECGLFCSSAAKANVEKLLAQANNETTDKLMKAFNLTVRDLPAFPKSTQPNIEEVLREFNEAFGHYLWGNNTTDRGIAFNKSKSFIRQAIKEAFERTRPNIKAGQGFKVETPSNDFINGYNACLQELKSNEEEYLK
jgi:hypothetical protein